MFQIRQAGPGQAQELADIHTTGFLRPWNQADMMWYIRDRSVLSSVALNPVTGKVSGFILARHILDEADILTIVVAPDMQGKGIGYGLCHAGLRYLAGRDVSRVHLEVRADNSAALALYNKAGFKEVRRRKQYYSAPGQDLRHDAICMTLDMVTAPFQFEPATYILDQF